jgi:hypothetical protein
MREPPRSSDSRNAAEIRLERLLTGQLATRKMSEEAIERMYDSVARVWAATCTTEPVPGNRGRHRTWGRWLSLATAAGLLASAIGIFTGAPVSDRTVIGIVARLGSGGVVRDAGLLRHRRLAVGDALRVGDTLGASGSALVILSTGGTLRLAESSRLVIDRASRFALVRGGIYLDKPAGVADPQPTQIVTRVGLVEHLGTEYEVVSNDQSVRVRVREGRVRFSGAAGVVIAEAGTELLATYDGQVTKRPVQTFGGDWQWTAALAPDFAVEGRSLDDYLQWMSRELGRPLQYTNAATRDKAQHTILHGSLRSPATLDALADVLSSTTLTYELVGGAIRVHSD